MEDGKEERCSTTVQYCSLLATTARHGAHLCETVHCRSLLPTEIYYNPLPPATSHDCAPLVGTVPLLPTTSHCCPRLLPAAH